MDFAVYLPYALSFVLLCLTPFSTIAQTYNKITLGSSLTANANNNSFWASPSREFAFGFQQIGNGDYLLAIWFNKIPEKTIVWSANRNNLAQEGSQIQLRRDGKLVLADRKGQQIWAVDVARVAYAAMLDNGNFELANLRSITLWQSFDQPTDTLLPTQVLNLGSRLVASFSETNYSRGRFEFILQKNGDLALYTLNFPLDTLNTAYWSTGTSGSGYQVIFDESGYVYLSKSDGSVLYVILPNKASTTQFYQRVVLEYDGVLRQYVYPKSASSAGGRPMAWSTLSLVPSDICFSILQNTGGGACGFNSYCVLGIDQRPQCKCPYGYIFINPKDELGGCKPEFAPQNCNEETQRTDLFGFVDMINTDWPLSDYEYFKPVTEDWCRDACLGDCFCAVAIFRNGNCWKKKYPLSNGRIGPSVGGKALIKIRKVNSTA